MFCEKCGTQLEDGTVFCTNCGAKQEVPEVAPAFTPEANTAAPQQTYAQPAAPKKPSFFSKIPVWGWIVAGVVLVALIVGGIFLGKFISEKKHTVDVAEYISVEFDGYDTVGTATVELDDEFWEEVYEKADFKEKTKHEKRDDFSSYYTEGDFMKDEIGSLFSYSLDKSTGLKNEDEVKVEFKVKTEKIKKKYGVIIKAEDQKFTVDGLDECETFNPFDDVDVKFTGVDGNGEVEFEITNDREIYDYISFYCDSYYLEEGDEVTVTFGSYSSPEEMADYCANEFGCIPTETEKTFTVEGLGHYIEDANEITSESVLGTMYQDGIDAISDTLYSVYEDDELSIVQTEYVGCAVAYEEYYGNYVYVVYKITADVTNPDGDTEQIVFYNYAKFEDGIMNGDGTCTYEDLYNVSHNTAKFDVGNYIASVYGYEDIESLREDVDSDGDWWENYTYNY